MNQNYYIGLVRARLGDDVINSCNKTDENGVFHEEKSYVYKDEQILQYLELSLRRLNLLFDKNFEPYDSGLIKFTDLLVQGAVINALASKALLEKGREFVIKNDNVLFNPPDVSELLTKQWINEQVDYDAKVRYLHKRYCYIES